jgi:hypothetical protein
MGITRYHAMNYKAINSMAMIYILLVPAKPWVILHRPSGKSAIYYLKKMIAFI